MKTLENTFVSGDGGFGASPLTYNQVIRNDRHAVYVRSRDGLVKDYEVFRIKVLKKGTRIFSQVLEDDCERYATTSDFGRTAWSFTGVAAKEAALKKYEQLNSGVTEVVESKPKADKANTVPGRRGRKAKARPALQLLNGKFTMKELLAKNPAYTQPLAYLALKKMIEAGSVVEVDRVKTESGRGRAAVVYAAV